MIRPIAGVIAGVSLIFAHGPVAQQHGDLDMVLLCQGMGEAVGLVKKGRDSGLQDTDNEGVDMINRIGEHARTDLMPPINAFLRSSQQLNPAWAATLYAHACMFNYHTDYSQVKLIARLIESQCDLQEPDLRCVQDIYALLPEQQII